MQLVCDEDNRLAGIAQRPHNRKEGFDLLRRQNGGRLVKDQHIGRSEKHFQNLDTLLDTDRQVLDQDVRGHIHAIAGIDLCHLLACRGKIQKITGAGRLDAKDDIFHNAEHRDQHEMLMHHANAGGDAVPRTLKDGGRTVN